MKQLSLSEQQKVKSIIKAAGKHLLEVLDHSPIAEKYAGNITSIVTQADIDTENFLRNELKKYFPSIGFYSEETFKSSTNELGKEYCWVVDPIDGTLNFSRGNPIFCIAVALYHKDHPIFGAVYFPRLIEYFWASKGTGTYLENRRLSVRNNDTGKGLFGSCEIGLPDEKYKKFIDLRFELGFQSTHPYCTVYDYAYTAAGRYDFAISIGPALWDIAVGWILVEEAGGVFKIFHIDKERKQKGNPYHLWCITGAKNVVDFLLPKLKKIAI